MWGYSGQFWQSVADRLLVATAILGGLAVIASFASSVISGKVSKRLQADADQRIAAVTEQTEKARADAARANENAARLENEAEQARLETERIKERLAWRRLSERQLTILANGFRELDLTLSLSAIANDPESMLFAFDIRRALAMAGMNVRLDSAVVAGVLIIGINVYGPRNIALKVAKVFATAGLDVNVREQEGVIQILIGPKPPP